MKRFFSPHSPCRVSRPLPSSISWLLLSALLHLYDQSANAGAPTALDAYVAAPDSSYSYTLKSTTTGTGYTAYHILMTSQTWRSTSEVNRTQWQHWMTIYKPTTVAYDKALLVIDGGSNGSTTTPPPSDIDAYAGSLAVSTKSVLVDLQQVPNEPLRFKPETFSRTEDALIAKSWQNYFNTGDITWAAQLPMTKAAVRAMDTVQSFLAAQPGHTQINDFVVAGASKRGWDTWLTAAVDPRVTAIVPMVADLLNTQESFQHHHEVYNGWSYAVQDYVNAGVMDKLNTPAAKTLFDAIDPYSYLDRLTMPKLMVNSTGDQFFLPDSSQFYLGDLPGQNYLRYVPNTDHSLSQDPLSLYSMVTFYQAQLKGTQLPTYSWTVDPDGTIRLQTTGTNLPSEVGLWEATNPNGRDFRFSTIGAAFEYTTLVNQGGGLYLGHVNAPTSGWKAYLMELNYADGNTFTTDVHEMNRLGMVPEPSTFVLGAFALLLVVWQRRVRRPIAT